MSVAVNTMRTTVKIPMMPKGVEHFKSLLSVRTNLVVKIPMMPKGVEH